MGLASLDAALTGLRASQQQISVISNNVANATTPGFTRKLLPQSAQSMNGETVGVLPGTIMRQVDLNLERDLWTQISAVGSAEVRASYLSGIEEFHGPPDAELSFAAEIARLRDSFSALSDSPNDTFLLAETVEQADTTARKINDLADLLETSRNDVQSDIQSTVNRINQLLEQVANLNDQVQDNLNVGRSTAIAEDKRDEAIKELTQLIGVSFFVRGDGVLVVQTQDGVELADTNAKRIEFNAVPLSANSYYPDADIGLYVVDQQFTGTPSTDPSAINITERDPGGRLGGLIELRDNDFPQQIAQLDEVAHKMALRFEAQGLMLFTDATGSVPLDTPPDPDALPEPGIPVEYVGFASTMRINADIVADNNLLRRGTYGATDADIPTGSNELITRVVEFTFGNIEYYNAFNADTTTQVDLLNTGGDDLQQWLGLLSTNSYSGSKNLESYASVAAMVTSAGPDAFGDSLAVPPVPETDRFTITFSDPDLGIPDMTFDVDLRDPAFTGAFAIGAADPVGGGTIDNAAEQLRAFIDNEITAAEGATPAQTRYNASVDIGANGQLVFSASSDIAIAPAGAEPMSDLGFAFLGLGNISTEATDPYFDIAVGNQDPVRITIQPGDTSTELLAKLGAVDGLAIDTTNFTLDGLLRLRPGNDYDNPDFGGSITITSGPFVTNGATYLDVGSGGTALGTRTGLDDGVNIASALFGSYTAGPPISNSSPITQNQYLSETTNGSGEYVSFRNANLGPSVGMSSGLSGSTRIIDYAQKMVNFNAQEIIKTENGKADDEALRDILQTQLNNESGVNIDEELANLIVYQTAFAASARVVNAVDELFQELLNAV